MIVIVLSGDCILGGVFVSNVCGAENYIFHFNSSARPKLHRVPENLLKKRKLHEIRRARQARLATIKAKVSTYVAHFFVDSCI